MSHNKEKLWTKQFINMSIINFLIIVIFYLLMVTIATFAVKKYGASVSQAGLVTGIYIIGTLLGRLFTGKIIHAIGMKRVLIVGLLIFVATTSLYFIQNGIYSLLGSRLVNGIGVGIASTATGAIVAQILPSNRKGEGIGYFAMSTTLGTAVGPFIGISLAHYTSYPVIFGFCMVLALICLVIALMTKIPTETVTQKVKEKVEETKGFLNQYVAPKAIPIALITLFMSFGYAGILSYINFFSIERNLVAASSFFFLVYAIAILLTRPFSGKLLDRYGSNIVMYPSFLSFTAGLILLSNAHSGFALLTAGALIGIGYGNLSSATQAIALKVAPTDQMALATATFYIALDAGLGIAPYILGQFVPIIGYANMYFDLGIFLFLLIFVYYFIHGRKEKKEQTSTAEVS